RAPPRPRRVPGRRRALRPAPGGGAPGPAELDRHLVLLDVLLDVLVVLPVLDALLVELVLDRTVPDEHLPAAADGDPAADDVPAPPHVDPHSRVDLPYPG